MYLRQTLLMELLCEWNYILLAKIFVVTVLVFTSEIKDYIFGPLFKRRHLLMHITPCSLYQHFFSIYGCSFGF